MRRAIYLGILVLSLTTFSCSGSAAEISVTNGRIGLVHAIPPLVDIPSSAVITDLHK